MDLHGLSFQEALSELADRAGIKLSDQQRAQVSKNSKEAEEKLNAYKLNRFVAHFYKEQLEHAVDARNYLEQRGLTQETLNHFYVGFAHYGWDHLAKFLSDAKAPVDTAQQLGLIRPGKTAGNSIDFFRGRVLFPITDTKGRILGFGGRIMEAAQESGGASSPKYLNSSESLVFSKSKALFGLFQAHKYIREAQSVIIVEGYFDVMALYQRGIKNVVATCGTALTKDHLERLSRLCEKIIVLFDGDKAGIDAKYRSLEIGLQSQILVHAYDLPKGLDPDEMVFDVKLQKEKPQGLQLLISGLQSAPVLLDSALDEMFQRANQSLEGKSQAIKQAKQWLDLVKDPIRKQVRIEYLFRTYGVDPGYFGESGVTRRDAPSYQSRQSSYSPQGRSNRTSSVLSSAKVPSKTLPGKKDSLFGRVISPLEKVLLLGLIRGQPFLTEIGAALKGVPSEEEFSEWRRDLKVEGVHPKIVYFLDSARTGQAQSSWVLAELQSLLERPEDAPYFSPFLAELGWMQQQSDEEQQVTLRRLGFSLENLKLALSKFVMSIWARFSQELKGRLEAAERSQDKDLEAKMLKEYLDVKIRMKELSHFYDKA